MKKAGRILLWAVGMVFVLSSIFKLLDPVGTSLVVEAYLRWMHLDFLSGVVAGLGVSLILGAALSFAEAIVGLALVTGIFPRVTRPVTFVLLGFFTLISIALVIFNPNMDCGCFGSAIHLTHSQTFWKNIVLLVFAVCGFRLQGGWSLGRKRVRKGISFVVSLAILAGFFIWNLLNLPVKDFTEYAPGDSVENIAFCPEDEDFPIPLPSGEKVMVVSVYDPQALGREEFSDILQFQSEAENRGFETVLLKSDGADGIFCFCDRKTLLTLNRSNGGLTLISEGKVVEKFPFRTLASFAVRTEGAERSEEVDWSEDGVRAEGLDDIYEADPIERMYLVQSRSDIRYHAFLLAFFTLLVIL
ncbi:MAG: hypothetical protein MJY62_04455 [Bacteroidales bacterium]|nr:hypothetical protein [Bacteroidales bacterium]